LALKRDKGVKRMTNRTVYLAAAAISGLAALVAPSAQAKYVASFQEVGPNVVEEGRGTLDLTDLSRAQESDEPNVPLVDPPLSDFFSGTAVPVVAAYTAIFGPSGGFGEGFGTFASFSGGDPLGVQASLLFVPINYVSGAQLSETSTYLKATFASLGLTPGTYVWSWGGEDHADTFTLDIGGAIPFPVPEPSTWAMTLLGFAGLGYASLRLRGRVRSISA
jgi:PEP-CTERM motif-containing protein